MASSSLDGNNDYNHSHQVTAPKPKRQRLKLQKQVRFANKSKLFILPTKSSREPASSWYTEEDNFNFKVEMGYCSRLMRQSSCLDVVEGITYHLATKTCSSKTGDDATLAPAAATTNNGQPIHEEDITGAIHTMTLHLQPQERLFTRGIEHTISPIVLKLINHRRKLVIRRVLSEQGRIRQQMQMEQQHHLLSGSCSGKKRGVELQWRMSMELAQISRKNSAFAKEWAVFKLM